MSNRQGSLLLPLVGVRCWTTELNVPVGDAAYQCDGRGDAAA
jgi:hypothetical protein